MSIWPEIKKAINTKIGTPLNHLTWLNDYKLFGEDSYVFKNTNILHELYKDYELCMNDNDISEEAFAFVLENNNEVGKALSEIYGIESVNVIKTLTSIDDIANNLTAMNAIANNSTIMNTIANNSTAMNAVINSEIAINAVTNSEIAMNTIANNLTAMNAIANNSTIMSIIANNSIAMNAVTNSKIAMNAVTNSEIAMNAIVNSEIAMNVIANKSTAINAVANNLTAMNIITNNSTAMNIVANNLIFINAIFNNLTIMNIVFNSSIAINSITNSSIAMNTIANNSIAMNEITKNSKAIVAIAKSTANWNIKKPFIMKLNEVSEYISNVYNILTNTEYFTKKKSANSDNLSSLNQYCTASYAANGFIVCVLGYYWGVVSNEGARLLINNDVVKEVQSGPDTQNNFYRPASVTNSNINAIAIPVATFEKINDPYVAIDVYIAK